MGDARASFAASLRLLARARFTLPLRASQAGETFEYPSALNKLSHEFSSLL